MFDQNQIQTTSDSLKKIIDCPIRASLVMGSGLGELLQKYDVVKRIHFQEIPGLPLSTVKGHQNQLILFKYKGENYLAMQGRVHMYEGYTPFQAALPIAMMGQFGIRNIIITNAAGAVNTDYKPGDIMCIHDHINLQGVSPLYGSQDIGRFVDMTDTYETAFISQLPSQLVIRKGIYAAMPGPQYETPSEIRYLRTIGADAVGMSTVMEVIMARFYQMRVFGLSMISNMAAGISGKLSHQDVLENGKKSHSKMSLILETILNQVL